jgi:hypothetical protein
MSWGERSCGVEKPCKHNPKINTCNVDCPWYVWDGKTKPDSTGSLTKTQRRLMRKALEARKEES